MRQPPFDRYINILANTMQQLTPSENMIEKKAGKNSTLLTTQLLEPLQAQYAPPRPLHTPDILSFSIERERAFGKRSFESGSV